MLVTSGVARLNGSRKRRLEACRADREVGACWRRIERALESQVSGW